MDLGSIGDWAGVLVGLLALALALVLDWDKFKERWARIPPWSVRLIRWLLFAIAIALGSWTIFSLGVQRGSHTGVAAEETRQAEATPVVDIVEVTRIVEVPVSASVSLPFEDNFDNGPRSEWHSSYGDWRMVNGQYTAINTDGWVYSFVGDQSWEDYTIELDYSNMGGSSFLAILVRVEGESDLGLSYRIHSGWVDSQKSSWQLWKGGMWSSISSGEWPQKSGHIKIEVKGSIFTANVHGLTAMAIEDSSTTSGYVGIGIRCGDSSCPRIDNFRVTGLGD